MLKTRDRLKKKSWTFYSGWRINKLRKHLKSSSHLTILSSFCLTLRDQNWNPQQQ